MHASASSRERRWIRRAGVAAIAVCGPLMLAPTYIAAKQSGDPILACLDVHTLAGGALPLADQPDRAHFDWANGSVECSWDLPAGLYQVEHNFGGAALRLGSRLGVGVGLGLLVSSFLVARRYEDGGRERPGEYSRPPSAG